MRLATLVLLVLGLVAAGCGRESADEQATGDELSGRIQADGSSTVGPFTTLGAERFRREHPNVRITVGISGTGGGFERFCRGETDLSDASREIEEDERALCDKNGVEPIEFLVANDALTVVVNEQNDWAACLTVAELRKIWAPGSKVKSWKQVRPSFPDEKLTLSGPGTDSGTFDYFTEAIVGEEGASRSDYNASEDDNVIVRAVAGDNGGLGYFGFSYYDENRDTLEAVEVDDGDGCVAPSVETTQNGTYKPLSRPLFVYAKKASFERPEVGTFVEFLIDNEREIAKAALFIPLTDAQIQQARQELEAARGE